jgi:peptidoglycan/LPS O-acetylase OafA/YrhL
MRSAQSKMFVDSSRSENPLAGEARLGSLDGLRAFSIALVLLGHVSGTRNLGQILGIDMFGDIAHLGVVFFFVISGFLITGLLIKEHDKTGYISLKLFYMRRALRIFPASFAFISIMGLLSRLGYIRLNHHDLLYAFGYLVNYKLDRSWFIGHLWSLSVEEQFYLLWPLVFSIVGPRHRIWASAGFVVMGPVARFFGWLLLHGNPYRNLEMFPMVADSLAAGCLLAVLRERLESQPSYRRLFRPWLSVLLVGTVLAINRYTAYTIVDVFGRLFINLLVAVLIHRCVYCGRDTLARVLRWRPIAFVGVLSYSLYLWQQPFLHYGSAAWASSFPQNLLLAVTAALLSYFLLEKPLMKLRNRFRVVEMRPICESELVGTDEELEESCVSAGT